MDWIQRLNAAMEYIEANLENEIDYHELGRIAHCSAYHFQRMFGYMAGMPLGEYICRRRMSAAAERLLSGSQRIIDVAARYGYDSPTAFNRAFQGVHGIPPSRVREAGQTIRAFPPITFNITIKGAVAMDYRIEKKEPFRIVGISCPMSQQIEENFQNIPAMWEKAARDGTVQRLASMMGAAPQGILGVSVCSGEAESWRYYIAVAADGPASGLEEYTVPSFTWAIFPGEGTGVSIQELEKRIVTEWLPSSGYEYANGPDVEVYLSPDPQNARYEVWIPVLKKS